MSYGCSASGDASGFRGCGREFGALRDFDRHWTTVTIEDDPDRDRATVSIGGTRCATDIELRDRGMVRTDRLVWKDAASIADAAARFRLQGSTESRIEASGVKSGAEGKRA